MTKILSTIALTALFLAAQTIASAEVLNNSRFADYSEEDMEYQGNLYEVSHRQVNQPRTLEDDRRDNFTTKVINSGHYTSDTATRTWIPIHRVDNRLKVNKY